jgi:hypothetical protein
MKRKSEGWRDYAVHIQPEPAGWDWTVTGIDGRTAAGQAPDAGSARWCCDFTIAALEALARVGQRRF